MSSDAFNQTKTALLALGGQRVWSLMVTLFGDLAQAEGSAIDGPVLSAIMVEMDVRPEALRVALHRLRNDGWIASQKHGRTGRHTLTPTSRNETRQASARIYASPTKQDSEWQLVLLEDSTAAQKDVMVSRGFVPLLSRVYLGGADATAPKDALALDGTRAPQWLRNQIAAQMLDVEYQALLPILQNAFDTLETGELDVLQIVVLRCLIVHNWRRIVLRHPSLPRTVLPENWAGHRCHVLVDTLLTRFPRPALIHIPPH
jgi:phenylacetic acid degradation operon negative regulatory protein